MICKHNERLSRVSTNSEPMRWAHRSDGVVCTPDQEKTFARCDKLCAAIRAFRKLEGKSAGRIQ